jgi:peptidoglycan/xylan/chitin deacetylase (PgdA/CDA1 family)
VGANTDDSRLLPIGGLEFDGVNDFLSQLPAKNPSGWTVINAREDRVEAVDSAGGSFVNGTPQPGASEWLVGTQGAYKGHLNFLAHYNRVLSANEQKQAFDAIVDKYSNRPGYEFVSKPVLNISFDDSRATDYIHMFPAFRSRSVNGTSFVTTSHINRNDSDPFYLSENRIRMMRSAGWEFGSHNVVHLPLTTLSEARIRTELSNSKSDIQRILPRYTPLCYAYTTGAYTARIRKIVLEYYPYARDAGGAYLNGTQVAPTALIVKRDLVNVPLATLKADIDEALASGKMLLWYTHITTAADGERIGAALDYAISRGLPIMTMADAMAYMRNRLLPRPAVRR